MEEEPRPINDPDREQATKENPPRQQMSALDRLKLVQAQFKTQWTGIPTEYTDRPGTSNLTN
jgi:hypothetical protein